MHAMQKLLCLSVMVLPCGWTRLLPCSLAQTEDAGPMAQVQGGTCWRAVRVSRTTEAIPDATRLFHGNILHRVWKFSATGATKKWTYGVFFSGFGTGTHFGTLLGDPLGVHWEPLGSLWAPFGSPWDPFGHPWSPLGLSWGSLGTPLGSHFAPLGALWHLFGTLGGPMGIHKRPFEIMF